MDGGNSFIQICKVSVLFVHVCVCVYICLYIHIYIYIRASFSITLSTIILFVNVVDICMCGVCTGTACESFIALLSFFLSHSSVILLFCFQFCQVRL